MKAAYLGFAAVLLGGLLFAGPVSAGPLICPEEDSPRTLTLTAITGGNTITCGVSGATAGGTPIPQVFSSLNLLESLTSGSGGSFITSIVGLGAGTGSFTLVDGVTDGFLVFKFGANINPDYIGLDISGSTSGVGANWSVAPNQGGSLSGIWLFGQSKPVPEPAALFLLGLGLIGLVIARRRNVA